MKTIQSISKMSHPRCVYINNRCRYQWITQQYLKRCLIKDEVNYMFRPNVAIIRFSSESMVVVLYRIGMGMSRWWDLSICDVCYMLLLRERGGIFVVCYLNKLDEPAWIRQVKPVNKSDRHGTTPDYGYVTNSDICNSDITNSVISQCQVTITKRVPSDNY